MSSLLAALSPQAREELESLIDARVQEALRRREPRQRWATVREAAKLLGLSERALRGRIERGRIPVQHQGRSVIVDLAALDGELENGP